MDSIKAVKDRATLLGLTRSELVGPSRFSDKAAEVKIEDKSIRIDETVGPAFIKNETTGSLEEVLYDRSEGPARKYGVGILYPTWEHQQPIIDDQLEDTVGYDTLEEDDEDEKATSSPNNLPAGEGDDEDDPAAPVANRYQPSSLGISFCVRLGKESKLIVGLPHETRFDWQVESDESFPVNGYYRPVEVLKKIEAKEQPIRNRGAYRTNAFPVGYKIEIESDEIESEPYLTRSIDVSEGSGQVFNFDVRVRRLPDPDHWLLTLTLRNQTTTDTPRQPQFMLFQTFFDVQVEGDGNFAPYPTQKSEVAELDQESLQLLYSSSKIWATGHNCAAGWNSSLGTTPTRIFADVFPVVETPSMTPDIEDADKKALQFSMTELAELDGTGASEAWQKLNQLVAEYENWVNDLVKKAATIEAMYSATAQRHIDDCQKVLNRIRNGIETLRTNENARIAFRLANKSMVLQQLATKEIENRPLEFDKTVGDRGKVVPSGEYRTPFQVFASGKWDSSIGNWRAFQLAFLLMNIPDFLNEGEKEFEALRENIELIWFPTGGGKTEAYLGVAAYALFLSRLNYNDQVSKGGSPLPVDGTNILMRYTLRMLTTQQFQRAAALICAMECVRQNFDEKKISGRSFSLGLWIGGSSSPNKNEQAKAAVSRYRNSTDQRNSPLIVTECPWCRAQLGKADIKRPPKWKEPAWKQELVKGIVEIDGAPKLCCSDLNCAFSDELPILVVDEQIYDTPPSLIIATADKFAVVTFRPESRAMFGRDEHGTLVRRPPFLIIQDETHLIAGPLGTLFGLYESVIEKLCTLSNSAKRDTKPKIICSTATIRGANDQLSAIFARDSHTLFPSPGLDISDSFFGRYAREEDGKTLKPGRMYAGVSATGFVSSQTTQVRTFSSLLVNVRNFIDEPDRDPWWTILSFYNSLRELGGALTLFQGDIKSRMKFLTRRDRIEFRHDPEPVELSSRLEQSEIVAMMDRMEISYPKQTVKPIDVCLASSIIEVGVDINRLSLMAVVGQPKNTAQYIQVTGRVGRKWWERPGLIFTMYSSTKIRDQSHYEQFYSYHHRLYEQVEPTSATPFSRASLERAAIGAMLLYARSVKPNSRDANFADFQSAIAEARDILVARCRSIEKKNAAKQVAIIEELHDHISTTWSTRRLPWETFPLGKDDSVLMRWPGQFATAEQKKTSFEIPSSLRQVDKSGELAITKHYLLGDDNGA